MTHESLARSILNFAWAHFQRKKTDVRTVTNGSDSELSKKDSISTAPYEIIALIFEFVGADGSSHHVPLGLTCTRFWAIHQNLYPKRPIPFADAKWISSCSYPNGQLVPCHERLNWHLGFLIRDWIGPGYRLLCEFDSPGVPWRYVKMEVYGTTEYNTAVHRYLLRHKDYIYSINPEPFRFASYCGSGGPPHLPNPFNMGEDWYPTARRIIMVDRFRWVNIDDWERYWKRTHIIKGNQMLLEEGALIRT